MGLRVCSTKCVTRRKLGAMRENGPISPVRARGNRVFACARAMLTPIWARMPAKACGTSSIEIFVDSSLHRSLRRATIRLSREPSIVVTSVDLKSTEHSPRWTVAVRRICGCAEVMGYFMTGLSRRFESDTRANRCVLAQLVERIKKNTRNSSLPPKRCPKGHLFV